MNHTYTGTSHDEQYERDGQPVTPPVRCHVGTKHLLEFDLTNQPALPVAHGQGLLFIPSHAVVTVTAEGTSPPKASWVKLKGVRATADGAPMRQTLTSEYTVHDGEPWPDPPQFVRELVTDALAIITRQDGGA